MTNLKIITSTTRPGRAGIAIEKWIQVVTTLSMMPLAVQVNIPFFAKLIDENGVFQANEIILKSAEQTLEELNKWSDALKLMRKN